MSIVSNAGMYWRFAWGLREFLKEPITLEKAKENIKQRFKTRENNFLALIKKVIYENEDSPYLELLKLAGCEYGDVEKMILCDGIEFALEKLRIAGVYVSLEEFKGKKEVIRSGKTFRFSEKDFDNPFIQSHFEARSGASRSAGTRTYYEFDSLIARYSTYHVPMLEAYGVFNIPFGLWQSINPGFGALLLLAYTKAGKPPLKWFSYLREESSARSLRHRLLTNYLVYGGRFFGAKWPIPEYLGFDEGWRVAKWMTDEIKEHGGCCLATFTNNAVRVCHAAKEKGFDLTGAKFITGGEPTTRAKRAEIEAAGACACPIYGFTEGGTVAAGCFRPNEADDLHLFEDSLALITHPRRVSHVGVSVDAFLFSSLLLSSPKVLLNVEIGDYGVIETRSCGCEFDQLGFKKHLYSIRAFDKLTGEGITLVGTDLIRIIEEVLPAKFGGTSIDYQIAEEEDEQGHTHLSILVSPKIRMVREDELIETVLEELRKGETSQRLAAELWFKAKTLRVKREYPHRTARGKLMPLHVHGGGKGTGSIA